MNAAAIAEEPYPKLNTTEQSTPVTNHGNHALNLSMVSMDDALVDRVHPRGHAPHNGDKVVRLYLCEIGQVKELTPEEENELVARTKRGNRKARERLIKGNLRRVVKISREYEYTGLSLLDLISEGNIGLIKAVERFEPTKGNKFSTFSARWIKQSIKRVLANQSKPISRRLDNGNQSGLLQVPAKGARPSRPRQANIRILDAIRNAEC